MTHIAGMPIALRDRWYRQRCAWCGELLIDGDVTMEMSIGGGSPGCWEEGALVRLDGPASFTIGTIGEEPLPDDCCAILEITR